MIFQRLQALAYAKKIMTDHRKYMAIIVKFGSLFLSKNKYLKHNYSLHYFLTSSFKNKYFNFNPKKKN